MSSEEQVTSPTTKECMEPCLDVKGNFITAKVVLRTNDKLARKIDAGLILDELNRGLWKWDDDREHYLALKWKVESMESTWKKRKTEWDNRAFHFKDKGKEKESSTT